MSKSKLNKQIVKAAIPDSMGIVSLIARRCGVSRVNLWKWLKKNATAGASVFNLRCCEPILFYGKFEKKRPTDYFDFSSGFAKELTEAQRASGCENKHAPAKPLELWKELILMLSNDPFIDFFLGNGTSIIAAEQLNRTCYGMEIDPVYCDVIVARWEKLTGQKAVLENGPN